MRPAPSSRSARVSLAARVTRSLWKAAARRMLSASSSDSPSTCTTPVSHSRVLYATLPLTDRSKSQRGADVRTPIRTSGRLARMALMTSIEREACPNPWPEI